MKEHANLKNDALHYLMTRRSTYGSVYALWPLAMGCHTIHGKLNAMFLDTSFLQCRCHSHVVFCNIAHAYIGVSLSVKPAGSAGPTLR
jgi:hypothetical protein